MDSFGPVELSLLPISLIVCSEIREIMTTNIFRTCWIGSRIRDMEAEWGLKLKSKLISFLGKSMVSRTGAEG